MNKKLIVVTGGAKGIGKEIAKLYLKNDYNVCIIDYDKEAILKTDKLIDCYYGDVSDEKKMEIVFDSIYKKYGRLDILINNAGRQNVSSLDELSAANFKEIVNNNLNGVFICSKFALKYMKEKGKILNILYVHHFKPRLNKYHYDASKAAINMLTKEMALEVASKGITINSLSFGAVYTDMNSDWSGDSKEVLKTISKVPLRIIFESEQIALFAKNILDYFADYTTGSDFVIDGGRSLV